MIRKYELKGEGVKGALGFVYPAFDTELHRDVELVAVHAALVSSLDDRARCIRAAQAQGKLVHHTICTLFDVFEHEGWLCIAREHIAGMSVRQMIDSAHGPLASDETIRIACGVLAGLHYAHEEGVVHRHITPSNIVVDTKGRPRITDFAIGEAVGTGQDDGYLSPEQCRGEQAGPATDIFLLGMTLYEMLTGERAVNAASGGSEPGEFRIRGAAPHGQEADAHVPEWLCTVLRKALAQNPADRFASAGAFAGALQQPGVALARQPDAPVAASLAHSSSTAPDPHTAVEGVAWIIPGIEMQMAWIPSGRFDMGCTDADAHRDEKPVHRVTISEGFWMGACPVTQHQWRQIMGNDPSRFIGASLPVESVEWVRCTEFCRKLTKTHADAGSLPEDFCFRLPREAEWEYACRAGTTTRYHSGASETDLARTGWYMVNSHAATQPVGSREPNQFGLYDMHGNVWEWCNDWYALYDERNVTDPCGPGNGIGRVVRGGSWDCDAWFCRSSIRYINCPHLDSYIGCFGFRIVCARR